MIRNPVISLCLALILVACGNDSSGKAEPSGAGGMQSAVPDSANVSEAAAAEGPFEMPVADVFTISGKGVVVTGQVKRGAISVGDSVCIAGGSPVTVAGIEMHRKELDTLAAGDRGGLLLNDISKDDISKGDVIRSCD